MYVNYTQKIIKLINAIYEKKWQFQSYYYMILFTYHFKNDKITMMKNRLVIPKS